MAVAYNVIIHVFLMLFLLTVHNFFFLGGGPGRGKFRVLLQKQVTLYYISQCVRSDTILNGSTNDHD